jgi:hypothetical protein
MYLASKEDRTGFLLDGKDFIYGRKGARRMYTHIRKQKARSSEAEVPSLGPGNKGYGPQRSPASQALAMACSQRFHARCVPSAAFFGGDSACVQRATGRPSHCTSTLTCTCPRPACMYMYMCVCIHTPATRPT